jgi:hypothetical protein
MRTNASQQSTKRMTAQDAGYIDRGEHDPVRLADSAVLDFLQ